MNRNDDNLRNQAQIIAALTAANPVLSNYQLHIEKDPSLATSKIVAIAQFR